MSKSRGFTLIELLVVISIIALLIALLLPALGKAQALSKQMACQSLMRGQGQALVMYYTEHDNYYPGHAARSARGQGPIGVWPTLLRRYTGTHEAFNCPAVDEGFTWKPSKLTSGPRASIHDVREFGYHEDEALLIVHNVPFTYGYNDWGTWNASGPQRGLGGDLWGPSSVEWIAWDHNTRRIRENDLVAPSDMIAIGDNTPDGNWDMNIDPTDREGDEWPGDRHSGGCNMVFADGHLEYGLQEQWVFEGIKINGKFTGGINRDLPHNRDIARRWNNHHAWWLRQP